MTGRGAGAPHPFTLGFLSHVHGYGRTAAEVYPQVLDAVQAAEDLGFDGVFLAQHHFQGDAIGLPSPLVLLAAAAARTTRIALGTAISTIPLEDPLRFAEDVAVLDELSGGRVQLGLGTGGANRPAFEAFGVGDDDVDARYSAAVELLHAALEGEPIRGTGLTLQPPAPGLRARLWQSTGRLEKARRIAAEGDGLFVGTFIHAPEDEQLPLIRAYLDAWPEGADGRPGEASGPGTAPRIGAARAVFPGGSRSAALEDLGRGLAIFRERISRFVDLSDLDDAALAARINVHYGTSEEIVESLRADPALLGYIDSFFPVVQHEASTVEEDIRRLEVIATDIAPALGWVPARREVAA